MRRAELKNCISDCSNIFGGHRCSIKVQLYDDFYSKWTKKAITLVE
ncbi:hypothetical protein KP509_14G096000 [Ceratopteris richardii]|uniref:Uncharacterized protein n=1 Tax=Ceratopteris richardii TaxID=49495 RepID=A0A8T2TAJ4_CERRI|nr:hypothetical protein KP509_14G096000 [Ceratopteris richardii]